MKGTFNNKLINMLTGITLLVVGGMLILWGYNESESLDSQLVRLFTDKPTQITVFYYLGGGVCLLLGLVNLFRR